MNVSEADQNETQADNSVSRTTTPASYRLLRAKWPEYEISYQIMITTGWIIIVLGSVSHALSLTVLLGSKRMRLLPLTIYLVTNALAGLAAIYTGLLRRLIRYQFDIDIRDLSSDFSCGLLIALTYVSLQLYSWMQAMTAVDRTVAVLRPLHYKRWCTWRRNMTVVVSVVLLLGTLNAIFGSLYHENVKGRCNHEAEDQLLEDSLIDIWSYVDLVLFFLFPTTIIVPCNFLTLRTIYRSRTESHSSGRKHIQLTIMLLVQNFVFVATTLPNSIFILLWLPSDDDTAEGAREELESTMLTLLQYLGTTFGFFIYSISARRFRRSIAGLFGKGCNANSCLAQQAAHLVQARQ